MFLARHDLVANRLEFWLLVMRTLLLIRRVLKAKDVVAGVGFWVYWRGEERVGSDEHDIFSLRSILNLCGGKVGSAESHLARVLVCILCRDGCYPRLRGDWQKILVLRRA